MIAALRDLLARATPGPWIHARRDNRIVTDQPSRSLWDIVPRSLDVSEDERDSNAALIVALRNAAPSLLDIAEKVEALKVEVVARYPGKPVSEWPKQYQDVVAALDALETDK